MASEQNKNKKMILKTKKPFQKELNIKIKRKQYVNPFFAKRQKYNESNNSNHKKEQNSCKTRPFTLKFTYIEVHTFAYRQYAKRGKWITMNRETLPAAVEGEFINILKK